MTQKIGGIETHPVAVGAGAPVPRTRDATAQPGSGTANHDANVSITREARQLATLERVVADAPIVNEAKVAEISRAIEDGRYKVEAQRVADRMLRLQLELERAARGEK